MRGASIRRPRAVLAAWLVALAVLGALGMGVDDHLVRSDLAVSGTPSSAAREVAAKHFGESHALVVLLEGPRAAVDAQGRRLATELDHRAGVSVVGPWIRGSAPQLRPAENRALVLVRVERPFNEVSKEFVPFLRSTADRVIHTPVKSHVSGYADVGSGVHRESLKALAQAELIAGPLLLIVLLLVFRSVVAASLPLLLGMATIGMGRGVIDIVNRFHDVDVVVLNMASMMGLALGVDYSLVLVSRFREELALGARPREAALTAACTAGRTVLFAGFALGAAMTAALALAPGNVMLSSTVGVLTAVVLSVATATTALPAALVLLGSNVDRWRMGGRRAQADSRSGGVALRALRRPAVAAAAVVTVLAVLAAPALALSLGSPDPRNLPASSPERQDVERVAKVLGPGWTVPYEIVIANSDGRATDPKLLRAMDRWQGDLSKREGVETVMGPAPIARASRRFRRFGEGLSHAGQQIERAKHDQTRLAHGLARVDEGVGELRGGLILASNGATQLDGGASEAQQGAEQLGVGIQTADAGAAKLLAGLREARAASERLATGGTELAGGVERLRAGLAKARGAAGDALPRIRELRTGLADGASGMEQLRDPVQRADAELGKAQAALDAMLATSKADPHYARALKAVLAAKGAISGTNPLTGRPVRPGYRGLDAELAGARDRLDLAATGVAELERGSERLASGLGRLEHGAARLSAGIDRLEAGTQRLRDGLRQLEAGGGDLSAGLGRLAAGGQTLADGAGSLHAGAARLATGLDDGAGRTQQLESGVGRLHSGVVAARSRTAALDGSFAGAGGDRAARMSGSGYLPLAALDAAPKGQRTASTFAVNLDRGGDAARIVVVEDGDPTSGDSLRPMLEREAEGFAHATGTTVAVGGPATTLQDFESSASSRLPAMIVALVFVTFLVLVPMLRSLVLPLLAVALNVLTVLAAFGVLVLLFQGDAPLLGGAGDLDALAVLAIFAIVFGLSIDYEVFLLTRMREGYSRTGTTEGAVDYGLRKTAGVITGAAFIMVGVFVAFGIAPMASMRQLGVGLTVAVALDATVVRLILLPALVKLAGRAAWWLPRWLDRLLPQLDVDGADPRSGRGYAAAATAAS